MVGADGEVGRRRPRLDLLVRAIEEWELLLIPILFVLVIAVYANRSTVLTIVSSALLMAYAVGLISGVIIDLVNDPGTWRSVTQAILLPIALTVGTLPYIQLMHNNPLTDLLCRVRLRDSRGSAIDIAVGGMI